MSFFIFKAIFFKFSENVPYNKRKIRYVGFFIILKNKIFMTKIKKKSLNFQKKGIFTKNFLKCYITFFFIV